MEEGYIGQSYIEHMIEKTIKYGPYMFITEEVALLHSEIEDGSYMLGISCTVLKKPVVFKTQDGGERRAKIMLVLSAQDQVSHIKLLNDIMTIFKEDKNTEKLWKCEKTEAVEIMIKELMQGEE